MDERGGARCVSLIWEFGANEEKNESTFSLRLSDDISPTQGELQRILLHCMRYRKNERSYAYLLTMEDH